MLRTFGFDNAAVLDGGRTAWQQEDYPVCTTPCGYPPDTFHATARPDLVVDKQAVLAALENPGVVLINALADANTAGRSAGLATATCGPGGPMQGPAACHSADSRRPRRYHGHLYRLTGAADWDRHGRRGGVEMLPTVDLAYPFEGRWLTQNSPANRVPSHGTSLFATSFAIDFVPVNEAGRTAPITLRSLLRSEPAERFPGFGRPILAPVQGVVAGVHHTAPDHHSLRGLPSVGYALTQRRRISAGWAELAGNHVMIEKRDGPVVAVCHLQRASVRVQVGQSVWVGETLGRCGNSGNSTEPHVHLQAMDGVDALNATAVPISFGGLLPRNGEIVEAR